MPYRRWKRHGHRHGMHRMTEPRRCIMKIFEENAGHLSAEEVFMLANRYLPNIGMATVYRTLDILSQMNYINKIVSYDGRARYELVRDNKIHTHLFCVNCGRVFELPSLSEDLIERLKKDINGNAENMGIDVHSFDVRIQGLCPECKKNK